MREDESRVVRKYEDRLISACERAAISENTIIVEFIIAFYFWDADFQNWFWKLSSSKYSFEGYNLQNYSYR